MHPDPDNPDDHDPDAVGDDGADALAPEVLALLADADVWEQPDAAGVDRLIAAIESESTALGPAATPRPSRSHAVRQVVLGAVAAAMVMIVGVFVFSAVSDDTEPALAVELVPTGRAGDAGGRVDLRQATSGLEISLDAPELPPCADGSYYEAWVRTADDRLVPVGTFHGGVDVTLWAGVDLDDVVAFSVTLERMAAGDSAEQASSGDVVLKGDLPSRTG
jgi:hypothetical protein